MPYIKQKSRDELDSGEYISTRPGELNYCITKLILDYLDNDPDYRDFNEIMGVLECVKQEFYRRVVVPYEEKKCKENGDVYDGIE